MGVRATGSLSSTHPRAADVGAWRSQRSRSEAERLRGEDSSVKGTRLIPSSHSSLACLLALSAQ
eukprot:8773242-Pyramimonas_sp.AAC.1